MIKVTVLSMVLTALGISLLGQVNGLDLESFSTFSTGTSFVNTSRVDVTAEGFSFAAKLDGYFYLKYYSDSSCSTESAYSYGVKLNTCQSNYDSTGNVESSFYYTCRDGAIYATLTTFNGSDCASAGVETYFPRDTCQNSTTTSNGFSSYEILCSGNQTHGSLPLSSSSFTQLEFQPQGNSCDDTAQTFVAYTLNACQKTTSTSYKFQCIGDEPFKQYYSDAECAILDTTTLIDNSCISVTADANAESLINYARTMCYNSSISYFYKDSLATYSVEMYNSNEDAAVFSLASTSSSYYLIDTLYSTLKNTQNFGWAASIADSYAIIGDPYPNSYAGVAFMYSVQNSYYWTYQQMLVPTITGGYFGNGVWIYGTTAVVGAPIAYSGVGAAFVYKYSTTTSLWTLQQQLVSPTGTADYFGYKNGVYTTTASGFNSFISIGAPCYPNLNGGVGGGSAYIYVLATTGSWTLSAKLYPAGSSGTSGCGYSTAVFGNYMVVGCPWYSSVGSFAVYNFVTSWTQVGSMISSSSSSSYMGWSVSVYDLNVIVGAPCLGQSCIGFARLYKASASSLTLVTTLTKGTTTSYTGLSVSVNAQYAVLGAPYLTSTYTYEGGMFIWAYVTTTSTWSYAAVLTNGVSYGYAGYRTSINGKAQVVMGAFGAVTSTGTGVAYVYQLSAVPLLLPTAQPVLTPSPTSAPIIDPTFQPNPKPSIRPSLVPTTSPSAVPTNVPISMPSVNPTYIPSVFPTRFPTSIPTNSPSSTPSSNPSQIPSTRPTPSPTSTPTNSPSSTPSSNPSFYPTSVTSTVPTTLPSPYPSQLPSTRPTQSPTLIPTNSPSSTPSSYPSQSPSARPTSSPTSTPTNSPSSTPSSNPSFYPTSVTSTVPTTLPSPYPSQSPSVTPTNIPSILPTFLPTSNPTAISSPNPTPSPTSNPSYNPTSTPTSVPSSEPTAIASDEPSLYPSPSPTSIPSSNPTSTPTSNP
eukprot:gene15385-20748_t